MPARTLAADPSLARAFASIGPAPRWMKSSIGEPTGPRMKGLSSSTERPITSCPFMPSKMSPCACPRVRDGTALEPGPDAACAGTSSSAVSRRAWFGGGYPLDTSILRGCPARHHLDNVERPVDRAVQHEADACRRSGHGRPAVLALYPPRLLPPEVTDHHGHREAPRDARAQRGLGAGVVGVGHGASASHGHGVRRRVSRGGKDPWCPPSAAWQRDVC